MKGKFMKLRKVVVPALVVLAMAAQLTGDGAMTNSVIDAIIDEPSMTIEMVIGEPTKVYAAENGYGITGASDFTDYPTLQSHWGLNDINVLVSKNGIKGEPNGDGTFRFEPDREITTAELLSLILNTSGNAPTSTDWPMNVMEKAESLGLISSEWCNKDIANGAIPRERMASILYNTASRLLREDINEADYDVDPEKVGDIVGNEYEFEIKGVYDFGLIAGDETGKFNPTGNTTRAESCAIINRLFKYTDRVDNSRLEYDRYQSSVNTRPGFKAEYDYDNNGMITEEDLIKRGVVSDYPVEGDVINGVVVTRDPETGVLGYGNGQKGGIYLGVEIAGSGGVKIEVNSENPVEVTLHDNLANGHYEQHGDYVYWTKEWMRIGAVVQPRLNAQYPDAPEGACADIYGNIIEGIDDLNFDKTTDDGVFFIFHDGRWVCLV